MAQTAVAPRGRGRPRAGEEIDLDALLQAALEAFAETGYDGTSVRELSRRSDRQPTCALRRRPLRQPAAPRGRTHSHPPGRGRARPPDSLRDASLPGRRRRRGPLRQSSRICAPWCAQAPQRCGHPRPCRSRGRHTHRRRRGLDSLASSISQMAASSFGRTPEWCAAGTLFGRERGSRGWYLTLGGDHLDG